MRALFLVPFLLTYPLIAQGDDQSLCEVGNFSLPLSQQIGPLISFGQNIIQADALQLTLVGNELMDVNERFIDIIPGILWGVTDTFSIYFTVSTAPHYRQNTSRSRGIEDITLQLEYAVFSKDYSCANDMVTLVANASFPTGSSSKNPPTGSGSMSFFLGTTYARLWSDWYLFTSYGVELPTKHDKDKVGNQYLYQAGAGYNIATGKGWLVDGLLEVDGNFSGKNMVQGVYDPNSGGNVIYVTPSIYASTTHWIFQLGFGFVVQQHWFGIQNQNKYLWSANIDYTF